MLLISWGDGDVGRGRKMAAAAGTAVAATPGRLGSSRGGDTVHVVVVGSAAYQHRQSHPSSFSAPPPPPRPPLCATALYAVSVAIYNWSRPLVVGGVAQW